MVNKGGWKIERGKWVIVTDVLFSAWVGLLLLMLLQKTSSQLLWDSSSSMLWKVSETLWLVVGAKAYCCYKSIFKLIVKIYISINIY